MNKGKNVACAMTGTRSGIRSFGLCVLVLLQVSPAALASASVHHTPYDSFLWVQVSSVKGLVNEVEYNPKIAARYAKLYHVSPQKVMTYFKHYLVLAKLRHALRGKVYCVRPDGSLFVTQSLLKAGTEVFALRDGRPVLEWACGNPLTSALPANPPKQLLTGNVDYTGGKNKHRKAALFPTNGDRSGRHGLPLQEGSNQNWVPTAVVTPVELVSPYSATLPDVSSPEYGGPEDFNMPEGNFGPSDFPSSSLFSALPFTLLPFIHSHDSGQGSSPSGPTPPPPAPEMSSLLAWPIAGSFLVLWAAIRRRTKTQRS